MSEHTVKLGPLAFVTVLDGLTETLGSAVEVVAGAFAAADPKPREFNLVLPIRPLTVYAEGTRLRRQVRALLNNPAARMQGLYFAWDVDPEVDGWLLVGAGDLEPAEGGITMADFKLTLKDCYLLGRRRTHRPAVQVSVADRRLSTVPRDTLRRLYSTDFAAMAALARVALPVGVFDLTTYGPLPELSAIASAAGDVLLAENVQDGQVVSFEQLNDLGEGAVAIWDRRDSVLESEWEAVFGADQIDGLFDVPVIENGICRVRWETDVLVLKAWQDEAWSERGRIPLGTFVSAFVRAWSTERGVIAIVALDPSGVRLQIYVTLQRGWSGPLVEVYTSEAALLRYVLATTGVVSYRQPTSTGDVIASGRPLAAGSVAAFTSENWVQVTADGLVDGLAVLAAATATARGSETAVYGTARSYVELSAEGYVAARIGLASRPAAGEPQLLGQQTLCDARAVPALVTRA